MAGRSIDSPGFGRLHRPHHQGEIFHSLEIRLNAKEEWQYNKLQEGCRCLVVCLLHLIRMTTKWLLAAEIDANLTLLF
jgi:hypothetical protein